MFNRALSNQPEYTLYNVIMVSRQRQSVLFSKNDASSNAKRLSITKGDLQRRTKLVSCCPGGLIMPKPFRPFNADGIGVG
jgi:hypothetical protein